ncbi:MAG TPA: glutamate--cysteine ligase [Actinomycetota bacterium]|jgi:glutamate---cysteine ligase / carboxylate-amine ligase|nr:glutamate--cysteine ligase [Actinomycetota bacterium]
MNIVFSGSDQPTLGAEIEVQVVDEAGALATDTAATKILAELDGQPGFKHELLECTVEVITDVCPTVSHVRRDLSEKVERLTEVAERQGYRIMCSGTHPFSSWADQTVSPDPRYHRLIEDCQWTARRLLIFGVHTHVGLRSGEEAIAVANSLATFIPHFLALSSSSPFWQGRDTGLASLRSKVFESLPTAGLPYFMENWGQFQRFMRTLIGAGTIRSIREVWWDIRPHPSFGTLELRICDGIPSMDELCAMVALSQSLVVWLADRYNSGLDLPQHQAWTIRENKWRAARWGLDAEIIRDEEGNLMSLRRSVGDLIERLCPTAERLGCLEELQMVESILERGTSATRQREVYAQTRDLSRVVDSLVEEMRTGSPRPLPDDSLVGGTISRGDPLHGE